MPIPFSKVSSIEVAIETEALAEGGENRYVHSLSKPVGAEKSLVLERGADSGLLGAVTMTAANMFLSVGSIFEFIIISVLDQRGLPKKLYVAHHAILKKRRCSDLNAMSGEVFIESLEFVYRELTEVPGVNIFFGLM
jgi:phage tail-like protein